MNFIKLDEEAAALDDLWHAAMQSRLRDTKITVDGKISGEHWDAFAGKVLQIARLLRVIRGGGDRNTSREYLSTVYPERLVPQRLEAINLVEEKIKHYMQNVLQNREFVETIYTSCFHAWRNGCEPHMALVQSHWRRALVLPWRRRRDIAQCLSDESSDVVDSLISDPWLTDHVYVEGELDERRLVDLAGIVSERGAAIARAKVMRRICASCGRENAIVREKPFPACSCGLPHYCSVACQTAHWDAHHKKNCGKKKKLREGGFADTITLRFCFNLPDGDVLDLYEIGKRNAQQDADAADAAVAAAVAAAAMRALSSGVVSD